jgi:hypothetical protein
MEGQVSGFTPGPWSITDRGDLFRIRNDNDEVVATTDDGGHPVDEIFDYDTQRANARLIAAAPELYEALTRLLLVSNEYRQSLSPGMPETESEANARKLLIATGGAS